MNTVDKSERNFMVDDVDVILLIVSDPAASRVFYEKTLGLNVVFEDRDRTIFRIGSTQLLLHPTHGEFADYKEKYGFGFALYLHVDNVDAAIKQLESEKVPISQRPRDEPWGERIGGFSDPDGYSIYLSQRISGKTHWSERPRS